MSYIPLFGHGYIMVKEMVSIGKTDVIFKYKVERPHLGAADDNQKEFFYFLTDRSDLNLCDYVHVYTDNIKSVVPKHLVKKATVEETLPSK